MFNNNFREKTNTWPAFVDLFSNLVIILIFLLIVFVFLWTTTSVFNKNTGIKTISELKQTNAEQSEKIRQMSSEAEEAERLLTQARSRLETSAAELEAKDLSITDMIGAYEQQVIKLQDQDNERKLQIENLTNQIQTMDLEKQKQIQELQKQLNMAQNAKKELADLEQQRRDLQSEMQQQMANKSAEYATELARLNDELARLNAALDAAEARAKEQEVQYVEMSTRLNKALADKVAELQDMGKYQSDFYKAIKMALGDRTTVRQDGDRFIVSSDILFPSGSYTLSPEGKKQLRLISNVIKDFESKIPSDVDWIIRVDGHTDKKPVVRGNRAYKNNTELSLLRATAVARELANDGVSRRRLIPSGFGDLHPVALGNDAESLQKNRRIELQLTNK
ncbi:MAG: OmpA family protein [Alphaproteobacteria bacterium]|nr:OmpA family protein [Alphaproteobacteria bacterium]